MRVVYFLFIGTLLLALQTTILHVLPDWIGRPDLLFMLVVFLATDMETFKGALLVLLFGFLMDIFSGVYLGMYPMLYLLMYFGIKMVAKHFVLVEHTHQVPLIVVSYLLLNCGIYIFNAVIAPDNIIYWSWLGILQQLLILTVIAIPLRHLYDRIFSLFEKEQTYLPFLKKKGRNRFRL